MSNRSWTIDEFIVILDLYFRMSYPRCSKTNPEVKKFSRLIGRIPFSASMRLYNYMSCDPELKVRNRVALGACRKLCTLYWEELAKDESKLRKAVTKSRQRLIERVTDGNLNVYAIQWYGLSGEMFDLDFQKVVFYNYQSNCAVSDITVFEVLTGCHAILFAENKEGGMKADKDLCQSFMLKVYLEGLIGIELDYTIHISDDLKLHQMKRWDAANFKKYNRGKLDFKNVRVRLNSCFLKWHMNSAYRM